MAELNEAVIKVIAGPEKKSRVVIERERKLTAYHEAGHAIVIHDLPPRIPSTRSPSSPGAWPAA